jgi:hypothetical protein
MLAVAVANFEQAGTLDHLESIHRCGNKKPLQREACQELTFLIRQKEATVMDRRDFLKGTVGLSIAGMAALLMQPGLEQGVLAAGGVPTAVQARVLGRLLQGTPDGQIFESPDDGRTWHKIAKFGEHCAIMSIRESQGQIYTEMRVQGNRFAVKSADARLWRMAS